MDEVKFAYERIYDEILEWIRTGRYGGGDELPTENELCRLFDVSLTSVRRALANLAADSVVTKIKGFGTIVAKNVRPVRLEDDNKIGVLFLRFSNQERGKYPVRYDYENEWSYSIYRAMYAQLCDDYSVIVDNFSPEELLERFDSSVLAGVQKIFAIGEVTSQIIDFLQQRGKFLVVYNCFVRGKQYCRVYNDDRAAFCTAVKKLIALGHRRIAIINGFSNFSESLERFMGYQDALLGNGIFINSRLVKWGDMSPENGYVLARELLTEGEKPTAIMCVNDGTALGVYDAAKELQMDIPGEISVFGHDNSAIGGGMSPPLATIDPRYETVGKCVAQKLKRKIWIDDATLVESKLVLRESLKSLSPPSPEKEKP